MLIEAENWPHQTRGKQAIRALRAKGVREPVVCVAPPGAGKSRCMFQLACEEVDAGGSAIIYVHRTALLEQLDRNLTEAGIPHGILAAGYEPDFNVPVQIASIDTVASRVVRKGAWELFNASLVMLDEAHCQTGAKARGIVYGAKSDSAIFEGHLARGATVLGFTGTPLDLKKFYGHLVEFGSYSELRKVGAHLPVRVYGPEEIDTSGLGLNSNGEYSPEELDPRARQIIGSAYDWWKRLNPNAYPAMLTGPSVACAKWFAWEWVKRGVPAAFIGGEECLVPGRLPDGQLTLKAEEPSKEVREDILRMSRVGEVAIVMNRFVLREAIDMPWLYHGIGATVFGGLSTFLQTVGRIQRSHPNYTHKIWQSHGGCYWRHGSPNEDRKWKLGATNASMAKLRQLECGQDKTGEKEGICCPQCHGWRRGGKQCPHCNHQHSGSVRPVRHADGKLVLMTGRVNAPRNKKGKTAAQIWKSCLWGAKYQPRTVGQAVALWYSRCREDGLDARIDELNPKPPSDRDPRWHMMVTDVWKFIR